jgi:hypothetical protein
MCKTSLSPYPLGGRGGGSRGRGRHGRHRDLQQLQAQQAQHRPSAPRPCRRDRQPGQRREPGHLVGFRQGCGSGSELDPDLIRSLDPDPGGQKMTYKSREKKKFY